MLPIPDRWMVYEGELRFLTYWAKASPGKETGGDLFGNWSHAGNPVTPLVLGPGPAARCEVAQFHQDKVFLQRAVQRVASTAGLQHIGQWHSHHRLGLSEPSSHDCQTVRKAFECHPIERFLLLIVTLDEDRVVLHPRLFEKRRKQSIPLSCVILPGNSPYHSFLSPDYRKEMQIDNHLPAVATIPWNTPVKSFRAESESWIHTREGMDLLSTVQELFQKLKCNYEMETKDLYAKPGIVVTGKFQSRHFTWEWTSEVPERFSFKGPADLEKQLIDLFSQATIGSFKQK